MSNRLLRRDWQNAVRPQKKRKHDPRMIALVRLLAQIAAERDYAKLDQIKNKNQEDQTP